MEQGCIALINLIACAEIPARGFHTYFFLYWPGMIFSFGWPGVFAWLALFVALVAAISIIIRHFLALDNKANYKLYYAIASICFLVFICCLIWSDILTTVVVFVVLVNAFITIVRYFLASDNKADHKLYYPLVYVCFLIFFSIIGFAPFSVQVEDGRDSSGRLCEGVVAFILAEVVHVLVLGLGLLFVASTLVAKITKVRPRFSFLELGPAMTLAITWAFSLGGVLLMPYISLWEEGFGCSWLEVLGWSAVLIALAASIITLLRHVRKTTPPGHATLFFQTSPVCLLIFLWGVGISPFLIKWFEIGRPDATALLILFGRTLLKLGFGGSLLLIASALVTGVTRSNPCCSARTIGLIAASAIIWGLLVGCLLVLSSMG